jgi:hypothetical protein
MHCFNGHKIWETNQKANTREWSGNDTHSTSNTVLYLRQQNSYSKFPVILKDQSMNVITKGCENKQPTLLGYAA